MKEKQKLELELLNGSYNYSELKDMVIPMLESMINSYKIQYMREWERDHSTDRSKFYDKISELENIIFKISNYSKRDGKIELISIIKE